MLKREGGTPEPIANQTGQNPEVVRINGTPQNPAMQETIHQETEDLLKGVLEKKNLKLAYERVRKNKGSAGIDGITVNQLHGYLQKNWGSIKEAIMGGTYRPQPVLRVEIPKPGGKGKRNLGIPIVVDRMIQQAILQILEPIFDAGFSESSYGFRKGRSAHQAVKKAAEYVKSGQGWVVDIDLEKFFDRVNHDMLMARVARKVKDKKLLKLIRGFLNAGVMKDGLVSPTTEGTPQGGPLSPLLSNIMLDDLDKELERRGLCFCRYADDCNIYVGSRKAGERVKRSITQFITRKLRLKVNEAKSAMDKPSNRKFLGYTISKYKDTVRIKPAKESVKRLKLKLKSLFRRARGWNIRYTIDRLSRSLRGWVNYFKLSTVKGIFEELDGWIRRRLRCILWRQWKWPRTRYKMLVKLGLNETVARKSAYNGRGPWWNAGSSHMNRAIPVKRFERLGLLSLYNKIIEFLNISRTAVYGTVRTVV